MYASLVSRTLAALSFGTPSSVEGLTMVPLLAPSTPASTAYDLGDAALKRGSLEVTEVSEGGSVQELMVRNTGERPVLLMDGEQLIGAKQNRVLNLSILVPAGASLVVPVSCVEAGRWAWKDRGFTAARDMHFARGRGKRMASVHRSIVMSKSLRGDQQEVWGDVADLMAAMEAPSETAAMADAYQRVAPRLDTFEHRLHPVPGQVGAVFVVGGHPVGLEMLDHPTAWAAVQHKLVRSYAVEALRGKGDGPPVSGEMIAGWISQVASAPWQAQPTVGLGDNVRVAAPSVVGAALVWNNAITHLAVVSCAFTA